MSPIQPTMGKRYVFEHNSWQESDWMRLCQCKLCCAEFRPFSAGAGFIIRKCVVSIGRISFLYIPVLQDIQRRDNSTICEMIMSGLGRAREQLDDSVVWHVLSGSGTPERQNATTNISASTGHCSNK